MGNQNQIEWAGNRTRQSLVAIGHNDALAETPSRLRLGSTDSDSGDAPPALGQNASVIAGTAPDVQSSPRCNGNHVEQWEIPSILIHFFAAISNRQAYGAAQ